MGINCLGWLKVDCMLLYGMALILIVAFDGKNHTNQSFG